MSWLLPRAKGTCIIHVPSDKIGDRDAEVKEGEKLLKAEPLIGSEIRSLLYANGLQLTSGTLAIL